jgi:hypothetical protein
VLARTPRLAEDATSGKFIEKGGFYPDPTRMGQMQHLSKLC